MNKSSAATTVNGWNTTPNKKKKDDETAEQFLPRVEVKSLVTAGEISSKSSLLILSSRVLVIRFIAQLHSYPQRQTLTFLQA